MIKTFGQAVLIAVLVAISGVTTFGAERTTAAKPAPSGDTLVVIARISEIPGKMPPNDLYNYVYVMKFRIIKIEKGSYGKSELLAGVYNPLIPRNRIQGAMASNARGNAATFEKGAVYKLTLIRPIEKVWTDAVEDEYVDSELDKYYAVRTDIAP